MSVLKILFVCTGNICRSPLAEGVFRQQVKTAGLARRIHADSAGMLDYHAGEPPDPPNDAKTPEFCSVRGRIRWLTTGCSVILST